VVLLVTIRPGEDSVHFPGKTNHSYRGKELAVTKVVAYLLYAATVGDVGAADQRVSLH
jgi:hypothetical protein